MEKINNYNKKVIIKNENNEILFSTNDVQSIYLYPLSLKDYILNINSKKPILLNIIKYDKKINYDIFLRNEYFNNLQCVELLVDDNYDIITNIINYLYDNNILITLNIKNINKIPDLFLIKNINKVIYIKIFWNYYNIKLFEQKLAIIEEYKTPKLSILIKSYLNINKINSYEKYINLFRKCGVDIYQLSKKLLPYNVNNVKVDKQIIEKIRFLEKKYDHFFISVKNLEDYYYPKFRLDNRNSKVCFACYLKPYLYKKDIIACKVEEILLNKSKWQVSNFDKCGKNCSDCASIYENDMLSLIKSKIKKAKISVEIIKE